MRLSFGRLVIVVAIWLLAPALRRTCCLHVNAPFGAGLSRTNSRRQNNDCVRLSVQFVMFARRGMQLPGRTDKSKSLDGKSRHGRKRYGRSLRIATASR